MKNTVVQLHQILLYRTVIERKDLREACFYVVAYRGNLAVRALHQTSFVTLVVQRIFIMMSFTTTWHAIKSDRLMGFALAGIAGETDALLL